ncbi:MAG TPA: inositol monophosphatase family protein [Nitriliruptorales bacterium]|nr:inositol monophosphatase family protein [Nitriliruptorales bacterium]
MGDRPALGAAELAVIDAALTFAEGLADDLRPQLLERFGRQEAELKGDGTLVTGADVFADERIAAAVGERFPDHQVVSEELDTTFRGGTWCWVIDPIDGTTNFVQGNHSWCVSIALAYHGQPVLGLVDAPVLDVRYRAVAGRGAVAGSDAFADSDRLHVRDVDWKDRAQVSNALVGLSSRVGRSEVLERPLKPRVLGCEALHLTSVAEGSMVAAMHAGVRSWDVAAGAVLVQEAGGVLVDVSGPPFPMRPGEDLAAHPHRLVAAASERTAREIIDGLRPG